MYTVILLTFCLARNDQRERLFKFNLRALHLNVRMDFTKRPECYMGLGSSRCVCTWCVSRNLNWSTPAIAHQVSEIPNRAWRRWWCFTYIWDDAFLCVWLVLHPVRIVSCSTQELPYIYTLDLVLGDMSDIPIGASAGLKKLRGYPL